jgi:hypothetical protein
MPSKRLSASINIHLTPEQKQAAQAARKAAGYESDNQMIHALLAEFCQSQGIDWPTVELKTEGKAKSKWKIGEGGKFVKP